MRDNGVIQKLIKSVIPSAVIAIAGVLFQMYTDIALIKQAYLAKEQADARRDDRLGHVEQDVAGMKHEQKEFHAEAIGKLNYIVDRHRK